MKVVCSEVSATFVKNKEVNFQLSDPKTNVRMAEVPDDVADELIRRPGGLYWLAGHSTRKVGPREDLEAAIQAVIDAKELPWLITWMRNKLNELEPHYLVCSKRHQGKLCLGLGR